MTDVLSRFRVSFFCVCAGTFSDGFGFRLHFVGRFRSVSGFSGDTPDGCVV